MSKLPRRMSTMNAIFGLSATMYVKFCSGPTPTYTRFCLACRTSGGSTCWNQRSFESRLSEENVPARSENSVAIRQKSSSGMRSGSASARSVAESRHAKAIAAAKRRKERMILCGAYEPSPAGDAGRHGLHGLIVSLRRAHVEHSRPSRIGPEDVCRAGEGLRCERRRALSRAAAPRQPRHLRRSRAEDVCDQCRGRTPEEGRARVAARNGHLPARSVSLQGLRRDHALDDDGEAGGRQ